MNKRIILITISIAVFIALPVVLWIASILPREGTVAVTLSVLPYDATVKIDDHDYTNKKTAYLNPGTYTLVVSKEGFETDTREITVQEDLVNEAISLPAPITADARRWVQAHQSDYLEIEQKAGKLALQEGEALAERYPLTKWLPLQKAIYSIGYKRVGDGIVITTDATEGFREAALQNIRDLGYDPSDYTIEFTKYRSPFNE